MDKVTVIPFEKLNNGFIDEEFVPKGKDEYYLREMQAKKAIRTRNGWRHLTARELEILVKNNKRVIPMRRKFWNWPTDA